MKKNTVLFVDDEISVLNSLKRGLLDEEYRCIFVDNGAEALEVIEKQEISVIVTDMRMPKMNGLELLKIVKEKSPQTVRVVLSGYTQIQQVLVTINQADIFKFITKPWKLEEEFVHVVRQSVEYYNLQKESEELKKALETRNSSYQRILKIMEEKLAEGKKDYNSIKNLAKLGLDNIRNELIEKGQSDSYKKGIENKISVFDEFYLNYLNTVPSELTSFSLKKLNQDLLVYIKSIRPENEISVLSADGNDYEFHDNYKLIIFILTSLCNQSQWIEYTASTKCTINVESMRNEAKLDFYIDIEFSDLEKHQLSEVFGKNNLMMNNALYNEICKQLNGNVFIFVKGMSLIIKGQMYIQKK